MRGLLTRRPGAASECGGLPPSSLPRLAAGPRSISRAGQGGLPARSRRLLRRALGVTLLGFLLIPACRSARPTGAPLAPLTARTAEEAAQQLRERRDAFRGVKSLMRVRATTAGKTQSFRATLTIEDPRRMSMVAYTPVGTTAVTLTADGEHVRVQNHLERSDWEGEAGDLGRSLGFLGVSLPPAEMAMLLVGLPPREGLQLRVAPGGLAGAAVADVSVTYDPPSYPAQAVVVTRGADRIEIQHLEVVE